MAKLNDLFRGGLMAPGKSVASGITSQAAKGLGGLGKKKKKLGLPGSPYPRSIDQLAQDRFGPAPKRTY